MTTNKDCISLELDSCQFKVTPNQDANDNEPIYEISAFSQVNQHSALLDRAAREVNVDARLIRAIMYMETTHGYYDMPLSLVGLNKSILPMNINIKYWGTAFGSRADLEKPYENIRAGAEILKRIIANLPKGAGIEQVATLYQNINASTTSSYGARVRRIYDEQPWLSDQATPKQ